MSDPLTPDQLRARFESRVLPGYLEPRIAAAGAVTGPPRFVSVGGQPGAGKGRVLDAMRRALPGSVVVNADELRRFHPDFERLMREDPLRIPEVTGPASGPWTGMATEYVRGRGVSAIVETTLRDAAMLRGEFEAFAAAGYETELRVVAAPLEVSRAGTMSRYVEQVKDFGAGRWTPGAAHDQAAANVRETVVALVGSGVFDRVVVQDRDGLALHLADTTGGGAEPAEAAGAAVDRARDVRRLDPAQARDWVRYTTTALRDRARLEQNDPDLLRVARCLATTDAAAVVPQAYPWDEEAQRRALSDLVRLAPPADRSARSDLARGMPDSLSAVRDALTASFPRPARDAVRQSPSQSSSEARRGDARSQDRPRDAGRGMMRFLRGLRIVIPVLLIVGGAVMAVIGHTRADSLVAGIVFVGLGILSLLTKLRKRRRRRPYRDRPTDSGRG